MASSSSSKIHSGPKIHATSYIVVLALVVTLVVNALATLLPLGGRTTGEISNMFPVLFTPAGYVFSIWSVIYLGLIGFSIYQLLPSQQTNPSLTNIRTLFILSCVFNSLWIFAWQYLYINISMVIMLALLATLIVIYQSLEKTPSQASQWLVKTPFSLYLGWISVATIANASVFLFHIGWSGWALSDAFWATTMIAVATIITLIVISRRQDRIFALVIVWAFIGIYVAHRQVLEVAIGAVLAASVILIALLINLVGQSRLAETKTSMSQATMKKGAQQRQ